MNQKEPKRRQVYILRDVVHSDIMFHERFFKIINTVEFQRLNRIKQLSCEYVVFPTATHTRFSHSIGTYHVMTKILSHFVKKLDELGVVVAPEEKDLALCSALLHDIGHASFSHTFERTFNRGAHEKWTIEILKDKDTELHKVIVEEFSEQFLERLIKIISKKGLREEKNPIFTLISQLVSSQMDADRMDYLLRDSYFTSVTNGNYDLERLIRSFEVVERDGKYIICVNEKYISSIEEYILARFYMHREVYQHSLKRQMESIIKKIFQRGAQLYRENRLSFCDKSMAKLLLGEEISLKEYLGMDDTILMYHMMRWEHEDDTILKKLCYSFLHRRKFYKNKIKKSIGDKNFLKDMINTILEEHDKEKISDFENQYFYLENIVEIGIYDREKDNIWVLQKDGELKDITEVSFILKGIDVKQFYQQRLEYINFPLFSDIYGFDLQEALEDKVKEKIKL